VAYFLGHPVYMLTNLVHIQYTLKKAAWFYTQPNDSKVWWESGQICGVNTEKTLESNEQNKNRVRQKICALQSYDQVFFLRSMSVVTVQALIVSSSCALKGDVMNKINIDDVRATLSPSGYWVQETDMPVSLRTPGVFVVIISLSLLVVRRTVAPAIQPSVTIAA